MTRTTVTRALMVSRRAVLPSVSLAKALVGTSASSASMKWTRAADWSLEDVCCSVMLALGLGVNAWEAIVTDHCRSIHGGLKYTGDYLYHFNLYHASIS